MARIRTIKPEFVQSESIGRLSREARLLFIQLWTIADDFGRARASSRMLASLLYPYDDDARDLIDGWLDELDDTGHIRRYVIDGTAYLDIPNWLKHQKIDHPSKFGLPEFREGSRAFSKDSRALAPDLGPSTRDLGEDRKKEESTAEAVSSSKSKYAFESGIVRLTAKDLTKWESAFTAIDVRAELIAMTDWAEQQGPRWFHAVSGLLGKRNRDAKALAATGPPSATVVPMTPQQTNRQEWRSKLERLSEFGAGETEAGGTICATTMRLLPNDSG